MAKKQELLQEIDLAFEEAGERDTWIYQSFQNLYRLKQLSHFQIFEINWFPGAARILKLIDQLHSIETSREDFLSIADLLGLDIDEDLSKENLVTLVKAQKGWRAKSFELDTMKKVDLRRKKLEPLFDELERFGYRTSLLPRQIGYKRWLLDAINEFDETETIYLNESDRANTIMVQSSNQDFICVIDSVESGLIEII